MLLYELRGPLLRVPPYLADERYLLCLRILLEELLSRFTVLESTGPTRRVPSTVIAGIASAPLVLS